MTLPKHKLSDQNLLTVLSLLVGLSSGAAAVILEKLIRGLQSAIYPLINSSNTLLNWRYFVYPAVGMLICMLLVKYVIKDNIGHGVTKVLVAISKNESRIKPHNMWSSVATSAITIGFGGSVGAEAPIVYTGAAIGSNIGKAAKLSYRNITILIGCGAAGAIAGIFKAPLAGVLFTLEILLFNISMSSMMPLLLSTVSATVVSYIFLGSQTPFHCTLAPFDLHNIPFYLILGVFCGCMSLYFTRTTLALEDIIKKHTVNPFVKWVVCAFTLGLLIMLFPPLLGEGYGSIGLLLNGSDISQYEQTPLAFLLNSNLGIALFFALVMLLKVLSMTMTNAGGGVGGTFGPTLFVGAMAGFVMARLTNTVLAGTSLTLPEQNFVLVGMAGLMAGVMQAPMTAIFLIAEISGGYELLVPLILTATISYGFTRIWEKYSIYTKRIAQAGELLTHDSDQAVLTLMNIGTLVRDKYPRVSKNDTLRRVVSIMSHDASAVIAVVDSKDTFLGLIDIDNIRGYMFRRKLYDTTRVRDIMEDPLAFVYIDENMDSVMKKFDRTQAWRLPVVGHDMKYYGFVSRSRILSAYRENLKELSQD